MGRELREVVETIMSDLGMDTFEQVSCGKTELDSEAGREDARTWRRRAARGGDQCTCGGDQSGAKAGDAPRHDISHLENRRS